MNPSVLGCLFIFHYIADFVLQSREMGTKKSQDLNWLGGHLFVQFWVFFFGLMYQFHINAFYFASINMLIHGVIDWYIWRGYKYTVYYRLKRDNKLDTAAQWQYWQDHLFYTTIGLDQLLHGLTLIVLAGWLL